MPKSGNLEVSILDKMKIELYNYLKNKKGGVNTDEDISKNKEKNPQIIEKIIDWYWAE